MKMKMKMKMMMMMIWYDMIWYDMIWKSCLAHWHRVPYWLPDVSKIAEARHHDWEYGLHIVSPQQQQVKSDLCKYWGTICFITKSWSNIKIIKYKTIIIQCLFGIVVVSPISPFSSCLFSSDFFLIFFCWINYAPTCYYLHVYYSIFKK